MTRPVPSRPSSVGRGPAASSGGRSRAVDPRLGEAAARVAALLLLVLGAVATGTLLATPAAAHTELVSTDPADGSTVTAPPTVVTLTFSGPVQADYVQVAVLDPSGAEVAAGDPEVVGETVTQAVEAAAEGGYTVSYRVFAADGHATSGELAFTVAAGGSSSATEPAAPAGQAAPAEPSTPAGAGAGAEGGAPSAEPPPVASDTGVTTASQDADEGASPWFWVAVGAAAVVGASLAAVLVRRVQRDAGAPRTASSTGATTDRQPEDRPLR